MRANPVLFARVVDDCKAQRGVTLIAKLALLAGLSIEQARSEEVQRMGLYLALVLADECKRLPNEPKRAVLRRALTRAELQSTS